MRRLGFLLTVVGVAAVAGLASPVGAQTLKQGAGAFGTLAAPATVAQDAAAAPDAAAEPAKAKPKRKPKPKPKKPKTTGKPGPGQILVTNNRGSALQQLTLTSLKAPDKSAVVAKGLAAGAKVLAKVPAKAGCEFSVAGEFEDGTSLAIDGVEVCKDRTLNLVE
jgi:hypothetical protein